MVRNFQKNIFITNSLTKISHTFRNFEPYVVNHAVNKPLLILYQRIVETDVICHRYLTIRIDILIVISCFIYIVPHLLDFPLQIMIYQTKIMSMMNNKNYHPRI